MKSIEFIELYVVEHSGKLQNQGNILASLIVLAIGLEIIGGFFDSKPLKSPKQSKLRFNKAVSLLQRKKYATINSNHGLYEALRNQLLHALLPSGLLRIDNVTAEQHLEFSDGNILFNPEIFRDDVSVLCAKIRELISKGVMKEKRIPENAETLLSFL